MTEKQPKEQAYNNQTTVFVGHLPKSMTENEIREKFVTCGKISRLMMQYYEDKKSKGSCFIEFEDEKGAERACQRDGSLLNKQYIRVNMAERKPKKTHYTHMSRQTQKKMNNAYCAFVGKVSNITTESSLVKVFSKCGKVMRVNIPTWRKNKRRGFAIVEFAAIASVDKAVELNGITLDGKQLMVMRLEDVMKNQEEKRQQQKENTQKKQMQQKQKNEKKQQKGIQEEYVDKDFDKDFSNDEMEEENQQQNNELMKEMQKMEKKKQQEDEVDLLEEELLKVENNDEEMKEEKMNEEDDDDDMQEFDFTY